MIFIKTELEDLYEFLGSCKSDIILSPVIGISGKHRRKFKSNFSVETLNPYDLSKFIFELIFIFWTYFPQKALLSIDIEPYRNSIYFQVLAGALLGYRNGFSYVDIPFVKVGGDGENGFGTNQSGVGMPTFR